MIKLKETKEMTEAGPVKRLSDCLEGYIHQAFTSQADSLIQDGYISHDERIQLSAAIGTALETFRANLSPELVSREIYPSHPVAYPEVVSRVLGIAEKLKQVFVSAKATFDETPWNGSASQWATPEAYCSDCLIDTNPSGAKKVKDKCHLPYRKPGSSKINKNALRAMVGGRGIPALKGVSSEQKAKAAKWVVSHWKSAFDRPAPDSMYKLAGMTPPKTGEKSSTLFIKDKQGNWKVILLYSNKWEDSENDILSEKAHQEYAAWVNETGFKPMITLFHQPSLSDDFWLKVYKQYGNDTAKLQEIVNKVYKDSGVAIGEAERVTYFNGFAVMVGKIFNDKKTHAVVEKLAKQKGLGNSHLFVATDYAPVAGFSSNTKSGTIVERYRSFEASILPRHRAANRLTTPLLIQEKDMSKKSGLTGEDRQWMEEAIGADAVEALETKTGELEKELDAVLGFKAAAVPDEPAEEPAKEDAPKEDAPAGDAPAEDAPAAEPVAEGGVDAKAVALEVMKLMNVTELQGVIKQLGETQVALQSAQAELVSKVAELEALRKEVAGIKQSQDQQVAQLFTPPSWGINGGFQASKSDETVKTEQPAADKKETTAPVLPDSKKADDSVLGVGFWGPLMQGQGIAR